MIMHSALSPMSLKIHEIALDGSNNNGIYVRNFICSCSSCSNFSFKDCASGQFFSSSLNSKNKMFVHEKFNSNSDFSENKTDEDDDLLNVDYIQRFDSSTLQTGDVCVLRADDKYYSYYLLKVTKPVHTLNETRKDDYNYTYPQGSVILEGNYLDMISETRSFEHVYVEKNKVAIISPNYVAGLCPPLKEGKIRKNSKWVDVFYVNDGLNEGLIDLCMGHIF